MEETPQVFSESGVAQWLACWAHNPKVLGSMHALIQEKEKGTHRRTEAEKSNKTKKKKQKRAKRNKTKEKGTKQGTDKETSNKTKEKGDRESMKWIERRKTICGGVKSHLVEWIVLKFSTFGRSLPSSVGRAQGP